MGKITAPSDIEQIFDKPGRGWTKEEHNRVRMWLLEEHINQRLFLYATRHLGASATEADAEVILDKFVLGKPLDQVIKSYDPSKSDSFWGYLIVCFKRFCWKEEERLQKSRKLAPSSRSVLTTKTEEGIEWEVTVSEPDGILKEVTNNATMAALQECVNNLTPGRKKAVILFYFKELRGKEVAKRLSISYTAVRTRLKNGRRDLKNCLQEKGYPSWKFVEYERQQNS